MWLWILLGIVAVIAVPIVWGVLHLRQSIRVAHEAIGKVQISQIDDLREQCQKMFRDKFGEELVLNDLEKCATILSARLDNHQTLKEAFTTEGFHWYFVLPVGAYLGELLRIHAGASWKEPTEAGPQMVIMVRGEEAKTHPFDKVLKQCTMGDKGDIYAYLKTATQLEQVAAKISAGDAQPVVQADGLASGGSAA